METKKQATQNQSTREKESIANSPDKVKPAVPPPVANTPLIDSTDEKVRELHNIHEKLVTDIARMNPAAAAYVRQHPCLTPESMKKWRCGYMPSDGGGDKRGWSLRGQIVYPVLSETGKVLAWVGRDVHHEEKERDFQRLTPAEREGKEPPAKHRFPKGFHRGQELFGQHASRLNEPGFRDFIAKHGLIVVEGFNDVINLDNLGIPSLAIMSNRITDAQVTKITSWAKQFGNNRVNLMFDNDEPGIDGAKNALWQFAKNQINVRLAWYPPASEVDYQRMQPESISSKVEVNAIFS
jgi:DNA primase